jgi:hypothetical protein
MTYTQVWDIMRNQVSDQVILRDEDQAHIPFDPANRDYVDYLAWLDEGNQPTTAEAPAQRPTPAARPPQKSSRK